MDVWGLQRRNPRGTLVLLILLGLVSACGKRVYKPPPPPLVNSMAILPFDSESNNVDAPEILQEYVYEALSGSAYHVRPISETNAELKKMGISDGGQLRALDPVKLAKDLNVEGLMVGYVNDFGYTNVGVYQSRKVSISLKLIEAASAQTLWGNSGSITNRKMEFEKGQIEKAFVKGAADQWLDKISGSPLEEESKGAVRKALSTLPAFRFSGFRPSKGRDAKNVTKDILNYQIDK